MHMRQRERETERERESERERVTTVSLDETSLGKKLEGGQDRDLNYRFWESDLAAHAPQSQAHKV